MYHGFIFHAGARKLKLTCTPHKIQETTVFVVQATWHASASPGGGQNNSNTCEAALIMFLLPHAFLISPWKLRRKGKKEVGIDASFRLIRGMICLGVSETNQSECGIRIQGRTVGLRSIKICDIMHEIMVKKEAISLNHDDTLLWHSPSVFLRVDGCTLCVCTWANKKRKVMLHTHSDAMMPSRQQSKQSATSFSHPRHLHL